MRWGVRGNPGVLGKVSATLRARRAARAISTRGEAPHFKGAARGKHYGNSRKNYCNTANTMATRQKHHGNTANTLRGRSRGRKYADKTRTHRHTSPRVHLRARIIFHVSRGFLRAPQPRDRYNRSAASAARNCARKRSTRVSAAYCARHKAKHGANTRQHDANTRQHGE